MLFVSVTRPGWSACKKGASSESHYLLFMITLELKVSDFCKCVELKSLRENNTSKNTHNAPFYLNVLLERRASIVILPSHFEFMVIVESCMPKSRTKFHVDASACLFKRTRSHFNSICMYFNSKAASHSALALFLLLAKV